MYWIVFLGMMWWSVCQACLISEGQHSHQRAPSSFVFLFVMVWSKRHPQWSESMSTSVTSISESPFKCPPAFCYGLSLLVHLETIRESPRTWVLMILTLEHGVEGDGIP